MGLDDASRGSANGACIYLAIRIRRARYHRRTRSAFAEETIANRLVSVHYIGAHASSLASIFLCSHPRMLGWPRASARWYDTPSLRLYLTCLT